MKNNIHHNHPNIVKYSTASLLCIITGILSFLICCPGINLILGIFALVLGIHELHKMHLEKERGTGFILLIIGCISGALGILVFSFQMYLGAAIKFFNMMIEGIKVW